MLGMHVSDTDSSLRNSEVQRQRETMRKEDTGTRGVTRRLWVEPSLTKKSPKGRENQLILSD